MPVFDYRCPNDHSFDRIVHHGEEAETHVQCEECAKSGQLVTAEKVPSVWGRYHIKGNNSASNTPKRWKGYPS